MGDWTVRDPESGNEITVPSRPQAEEKVEELATELDIEAEIVPPNGGPEVIDTDALEEVPDDVTESEFTPASELPERSVGDDPLEWVPGEFVDTIDGTQAINRKGFEVLAHFYQIDVFADLEVPPEETDHTYCRVKAKAVTAEGRTCEAYGSAHVERGDDPELLLEMADTRARKRSLSIATGVGAVAVEELKNEVEAP